VATKAAAAMARSKPLLIEVDIVSSPLCFAAASL
jgi:hypothetical protein